MYYKKLCVLVVAVLGLAGCAAPKVTSAPPENVWQDAVFLYRPGLVTETRETVFALAPEVLQSMSLDNAATLSTERRLNLLLARLYGPKGIHLAYAVGNTTGASDTWRNKRGDCLSLTILAYAATRHLGINANMQEVQVPASVERRDGVDFINGHVNVIVSHKAEVTINGQSYGASTFVIDFEPQIGSHRTGQWLTEDAILARFYNNRATEYLVQKDTVRAYAYYRAAILMSPDFAPAYANLAQLYASNGLLPAAERLLLNSIALGGPSYATLRAMHRVMVDQGRTVDAQHYADLLAKRQDEDPYYWMGIGMAALKEGRTTAAIKSLERAASLTTGFEELHFYLGVAYGRNGQRDAANKQLAAMRAINTEAPTVAVLSKKLQSLSQKSTVY